MNKKTVKDIDVKNKKVIVRVDYNVPMQNGVITDDTRITKSLPTIKYLLDNGAAVILMAHLGRPKGQVKKDLSLEPIAKHLSVILGEKVLFAEDTVGKDAMNKVDLLEFGQVLLLENLRFNKEEEENDLEFAQKLASFADIYVNDGFGVSHRAHASVAGITNFIPSIAGLLLEREINFLGSAIDNPVRPFAAILGGAKVSDKINVIESLLNKANIIIIGGGMANTFLAAKGYNLQKSLVEEDKIPLAKELLKKAEKIGTKFLLPVDIVEAESFSNEAKYNICDLDKMQNGWMALDVGDKTIKLFSESLKDVKTVFWNGPMGVFEMDSFAKGTDCIAEVVSKLNAITIVGGGDSVAAIEKIGLADAITHISTGGGASLEYIEGKALPGIESLDDLRTVMIAGNWKMHKKIDEALELASDIVEQTYGSTSEVVIFPPFTALETIAEAIDGKDVGYGAQDLHWEDSGAFTGAISGTMIADIGCQYVLIGHSERRHVFGENDDVIASKFKAAIRNNLVPVLCVGETEEEKENNETDIVIKRQLSTALNSVLKEQLNNLVIAYEPVWAIGSGKTASSEDAEYICAMIRKWLNDEISETVSRNTRILYGGSVNENNVSEFMEKPSIDGALVGGASLVAEKFAKIVRY